MKSLGTERVWGQLLIQSGGGGYRLRHVADREVDFTSLKRLGISELRKMATFNAAGQFRPLRLSPDLARDWGAECRTAEELWRAVQEIYPGSIPDWHAAQEGHGRPTGYRAFTNRQSGMYRITQLLSDSQAAHMIRACCDPRFCLKQRLWTVEGLATDDAVGKSAIPCLEPCAVLLEFARKAARIEQEEKAEVQLARSELESLVAAAKLLIARGATEERVGNVGSPINPRRLQLLVEKFGAAVDAAQKRDNE